MFQNINSNSEEYSQKKASEKINISALFCKENVLLYLFGLMVSMVSFGGKLAPFGLAYFSACCSNRKPVGVIFLLILIGTSIKFGFSGLISTLFSTILFILLIMIFRPNFEKEERNENQKLGIYIFVSSFAVQAIKMIFNGFLLYDLITNIVLGLVTYIFYKIFVNSLNVICEFSEDNAFSIEEVLGASMLLTVAFVALKSLNIFGLSITNILSVMVVLFLGWKHGVLVGGTAGITTGMVLGVITSSSPILVASYAISGMIAGLLNKLGKIGVIVGFCVGNAILTYVANGNTVPIITIREILIAALGLLFIPKDMGIKIEDLVPQMKCFPVTSGVLDGETTQKLNTVSETIADMARSCREAADDALTNEDENKELFIDDLFSNYEDIEENAFYDDLIENSNLAYNFYDELIKNNEMSCEKLIEILENNSDFKIEQTEETKKDLNDIVRLINATYRIHKLNILWKVKEANHKKILATELGGVSKVISDLADNIEIQEESNKKEEKYILNTTVVTKTKNKSEISGDNHLITKLKDDKYMMAISDGMGSGISANKSSNTVIDMLQKLLSNGFNKEVSIGLINSSINLNSNEETYATIDLSIVDLNRRKYRIC